MPATKKRTTRKNPKIRKPVQAFKTKNFDELVFFPEKPAKVNALPDKAILLPHDGDKKAKKNKTNAIRKERQQ